MDVPTEAVLKLTPTRKRALLTQLLRTKVATRRRVPLSLAQKGLWFLARLAPDSAAYNIARAYQISGNLDVELVRKSLNSLVARHDQLRATFDLVEGELSQFISDRLEIQVPLVDLAGLPEQEKAISDLIANEALHPFDLSEAPLLRACVLRLASETHILLLTVHHIICDGWSIGILLNEFGSIYGALCQKKKPRLTELTIQYADFARWQNERLPQEVLDRQIAYWRQQLAGIPSLLSLPTDRPRPAVQSYRGSYHLQKLSRSLTNALNELSRGEQVTLFMTLLAAFQVLLMRYTGQQDIVVGSPIAGRNQAETEHLLGLFVNSLVLRADLSRNPSFRQLLSQTKEVALKAYENQDVPFERLVEELRPERTLSYSPVFQVMFALQNQPGTSLKLSGLRVEQLQRETQAAKFDLTVYMVESAAGLRAYYEYNSDLFDPATVARMASHFERLLKSIVLDPDCRVSKLSFLHDEERQQLLMESSGRPRLYPHDMSIQELFEEQVRFAPDAVAVVFKSEQVTYSQLNRRANQLAHHLLEHGVGPEVVVAIAMERSVEMIVALLATLKAGGAYLPLDPGYPSERLSFMLQDARSSILITQPDLLAQLPPVNVEVLMLDSSCRVIKDHCDENPDSRGAADNLAYIVYTSGSTGKPKGVTVTQRGVVRLVKQTNYASFDRGQVFLQFAPLSFDASTFEIWGSLLNGARLVVMPPGVPTLSELGETIASCGVTTLWLTAGLFHQMVDSQITSLAGVRQLLAGGDVLSVAHVEKAARELPGCTLINGYGPTENTTFTCCYQVNSNERFSRSVPVGRPISNTRIYILDPELQPVPVGVPGELYIGGDGLARCYLNDAVLTAERFVPDPFEEGRLYRTGDQVRYLADGNVEFLGRLDQQVKVRGYRIELGEIESVLSQHPAVSACVVTAGSDGSKEKHLTAYFVVDKRQPVAVQDLRSFLNAKLPAYMIPTFFTAIETIPLTAGGKVDRRSLQNPLPTKIDTGELFEMPLTDIEKRLAAIWTRLLGRNAIGIHDDFFQLGGNSLLAVQLVAEIEKEFGRGVPLPTLFEQATIYSLAALLEKETELLSWPTLIRIQPEGTRPPLFCISPPNVNALGYIALARELDPNQPVYGLQAQYPEDVPGEHSQKVVEELATEYLKAMHEANAKGPYQFIGMCRGAHIALEMALRLEDEGQKVAFLGVLDTWAMENTYNYFWFLEHYLRRIRALLGLPLGDQLNFIRKKASDFIAKLQASSPPKLPNRLHDIYFPGPGFVPSRFPGRISVFRNRRQPINRIRDRYLGWESRAAMGVDLHFIPGKHEGLLREPYVRILAEQLERRLLRDGNEVGRGAAQELNDGLVKGKSVLGWTLGVLQALSAVEESTRVFLEII